MTRFHHIGCGGNRGHASAHRPAWRAGSHFNHQPHDSVAVRVGHPFGRTDRISFDQAIDDLGSAGEWEAVHGRRSLEFVCTMMYIRMKEMSTGVHTNGLQKGQRRPVREGLT
jgi:hypothetical protein